jgi:hypothetical protein
MYLAHPPPSADDPLNGISNFVPIENLYGDDLLTNYVKNNVPLFRL